MNSRLASRVNDSNAKWWVLAVSCIALFMAILDNLVLNVAMPTISEDLKATNTQLQWIFSAYTIVFASLQITAGGFGDRLGRKKFFLAGVVIFTAMSFVAAFVNSIEQLIAVRALQGVGAALIMPLSLSLISNAFPPEERGRAVGIWSGISMSGLALGPIVGGFIVDYWSWQWIFLINVPIGIVAFIGALAVVRESRDESGETTTDVPGTITVSAAIGFLTWALIEAGERSWGDSLVIGSFVLSAIFFALFIYVENRAENPMVPLTFFKSRTFTGANIDAFFVSFLISGLAYSMTLYWQNVHGFSPVRAGFTMLPMVITMMVVAPVAGGLVNRIGASRLVAIGMVLGGLSSFVLLRTSAEGSYWDVLPAYLIQGVGFGMIFAPMTTAVLNSVPTQKSGVASAVNGAIRETGFAFGVALLGTIMNQAYRDSFDGKAEIKALTDPSNPLSAGAIPLVGAIREGINRAGNVIYDQKYFPGVPAEIADPIRIASSEAFSTGIHRAFLITGVTIIVVAILSLKMIDDRIVEEPQVADDELSTVKDSTLGSGVSGAVAAGE